MTGIARLFMLAGLLSVLLGMIWGIQMSASGDHGLSPAHAHLNLLGWVGFSIFAFYYHLVPGAARSRLAWLHLGCAVAGVVLIVPGIVMALTGQGETLAKLGSVLTVLSVSIFAVVVIRSARVTAQLAPAE
ncbi:hypothetical protein SAMN05444007_104197 [Cribrihabitans marinus]|uniref:Uncharacterized protein n=1 Tax=Cribrihabitans marinus TaxID=1227549 RepID=A0A1H6XWC0_9RHOB|nr:hypothetical protein [Cribrihabitans marinus]GGH28153.1 hypothetical protein GCM10010973_16890 [Cribrihabitans marinus]SEJ33353.1 hypothetical protein SAMN05444007_104197 [Cribrihabitans marinus]